MKTDLGVALLGALAARQRLRLGQALRRACIAAALFAVALVLAVIALVLLAWSGFYLLLPKLGPAGAALVVGLVVLGLAAIVALIGVLAGRRPRRRTVALPRPRPPEPVWRASPPASACPPRRSRRKWPWRRWWPASRSGPCRCWGAAASGIDAAAASCLMTAAAFRL